MQSVVRLLAGGYSGTLLLSEQANPARLPSYPFATVKILTLAPEGQAEISGYVPDSGDNAEKEAITEYSTVSVQIQAFGATAQADLNRLRGWLSSTAAGEAAEIQEIGILTVGTSQRIPALTGAGFEERWILSLTFSSKIETLVSQIGLSTVEFSTTLQTPGYPGSGEEITINQEVASV